LPYANELQRSRDYPFNGLSIRLAFKSRDVGPPSGSDKMDDELNGYLEAESFDGDNFYSFTTSLIKTLSLPNN